MMNIDKLTAATTNMDSVLAEMRARHEADRRAWRTNYIPGGRDTFYPFELARRERPPESGADRPAEIVAQAGWNKCVVRVWMKSLDFDLPGPPYPEKWESWLCGYVILKDRQIPRSWKGNYNADALQYLNIHGGLTYAEWHGYLNVFGFDCDHYNDRENPALQDPAYVLELARVMEQQLLDFASVRRTWRQARGRRRVKMIDAIRARAPHPSELGLGAILNVLAGGQQLSNPRRDQPAPRRNEDENLQPKPA